MAQAGGGDLTSKLSHGGSGSLYGNLGSGTQRNFEQRGTHNKQWITINEAGSTANTSHQPSSRSCPWVVNRTANPLFVGRDETVQEVVAALRDSQDGVSTTQKRYALTGLAGIGKSEISLRVIDRLRAELWGVFWVDASSEETLLSDYLAVGEAIGSAAEDIDQARRALATCSEPWLLVLDNADNPRTDYLRLLPSGSHGRVLITSRNPRAARYSTVGARQVGPLNTNDARDLLLKTAEVAENKRAGHQTAADSIVELLEGHTLALAVAGSLIAIQCCDFESFPSLYKSNRRKVNRPGPMVEYEGVYAVFDTALSLLPSDDPVCRQDALSLLDFFSSVDRKDVPLDMFACAWSGSRQLNKPGSIDGEEPFQLTKESTVNLPAIVQAESQEWDSFRFWGTVDLLRSLALLQGSKTHADMHALVHDWARDRLDEDGQRRADIGAALTIVIAYLSGWSWWKYQRELRPHVANLSAAKLSGDEEPRHEFLSSIEVMLFWCADLQLNLAAYTEAERSIAFLKEKYNAKKMGKAEAASRLLFLEARVCSKIGNTKKSLKLLKELSEDTEAATEDQRFQLLVEHELAGAYQANGQVGQAVELLERVVEIRKTSLAEDHPSRLASQHALAGAYQANGQVGQAVELLERVVEIEETSLAEDHPDRLASQHALAGAYQANGQVGQAVELLERVVEIKKTSLADRPCDQATSQFALIFAYLANNQTDEAVEAIGYMMEFIYPLLPQDHPVRTSLEQILAVFTESPSESI